MELYIKKCLDSVLSQTYENLEVLIINDGSMDNCGDICEAYANKDNRIRVFHQSNRGLSMALNVGLEKATGDYIGFVDSDDWIERTMYEELYNALKSADVPISICSYFNALENESTPVENKERIPADIILTKDLALYPLKRDNYLGFCGYVWNKLYDARIIKIEGLRFKEKIKYGMDIIFYTTLVLSQQCTGVYVNKPLYHYLQRSSAISKSKSIDIKTDILLVYKEVERLLNEYGCSEESRWARGFYCYHAGVIASLAMENNNQPLFLSMQAEIKNHLADYTSTNSDNPDKIKRMKAFISNNFN